MRQSVRRATFQERLSFRIRHAYGRIWSGPLGSITGVVVDAPVVALTFDDGPHPVYTPPLLDILARYQARATFFCIGQQVRAHPDIAQRAVNEGHALANHTDTHPFLLTLSSADRRRELAACAATLAPFGGTRLFRPPRGHQSHQSRLDVLRSGHTPVIWSAHAEDWRVHTADWMADTLTNGIAAGQIILLHDAIWDPIEAGTEDRSVVLETVDVFLQRTAGRYQFVTVPELLRRGRQIRRDWVNPKS